MSFVRQLETAIRDRQLLAHPFYRDWMEGKLSVAQLRHYAQEYVPFVDAFPRFVSAVHSLCEDPQGRRFLLMNLVDEEGDSPATAHPTLWRAFAAGLGAATPAEGVPAPVSADAACVKDVFFAESRRSYAAGLGALYAYEYQIPEIAEAKIKGLSANYGIADAATLEFFEVHKQADVYHSQACAELIDRLPAPQRDEALRAARVAAAALWDFLTAIHAKRAA